MENELYHHGILGQKWGVRRFQNADGSLTPRGKKRYLNEVEKDMESHFKSNISKEAGKVSSLNRNGTVSQDQAWGKAYRQGKVTSKDDAQVKKAAKEAYKYAEAKYGKETMDALKKSGVLGRSVDDFDPTTTKAGKELLNKMLRSEKKYSDEEIVEARNRLVERNKARKEAVNATEKAYWDTLEKHEDYDQNDSRAFNTKEYKDAVKAQHEAANYMNGKYKTTLNDDIFIAGQKTGKEKTDRILNAVKFTAAAGLVAGVALAGYKESKK